MSGGSGGWATFLQVAGAVAAVAGSLYRMRNQPEEEEEVVILHVDGSLKRNKQSAGCGGYLSSSSQNWIYGFVQKLKFTPNLKEHETEKEA
ncbi:hypothetical protein A2U01_0072664, partial [Trifolium medium]|nr:hypothetical protein [Trifolium medium]